MLRGRINFSRQTHSEALRLVKAIKAEPRLLVSKRIATSRETGKNSRLEGMKAAPIDVRKSATRGLVKNFESARAKNRARPLKVEPANGKKRRKRKYGQSQGRKRRIWSQCPGLGIAHPTRSR